jgi:hypothetical protein
MEIQEVTFLWRFMFYRVLTPQVTRMLEEVMNQD